MSPLLWGAALLLVQAPAASISGLVTDASTKDALGGADATLVELQRRVATDPSGAYSFRDVPAGPQHLRVRAMGYRPRTIHVVVPARGRLEVHVGLEPAPIPVRPLVVLPAPVAGPVAGGVGRPARALTATDLRLHPALPEPDALAALDGGMVDTGLEMPAGVSIRGSPPDQTAYALDGFPLLSPYHAAGVFGAVNPDVVESVALFTDVPGTPAGDGLAGTVSLSSRRPGDRFGGRGSVGTNQLRLSLDGPVGGFGYLLGVRQGVVGRLAPADEPSYLAGATGDWLASVNGPLWRGRLHALAVGATNRLRVGAAADPETEPGVTEPHRFEWESASAGLGWTRSMRGVVLEVRAWIAGAEAEAAWRSSEGSVALDATRVERGAEILLDLDRASLGPAAEQGAAGARTRAVLRYEAPDLDYETRRPSSGGEALALRSASPRLTVGLDHERPLGGRTILSAGTSVILGMDGPYWRPHAGLRFRALPAVTVTGRASRTHQFAQSLRNAESVVGSVFPADLFAGWSPGRVPVALGRQAALGLEIRPDAGWEVDVSADVTRGDQVLLVSPVEGGPFAVVGFGIGSARSVGLSLALRRATGRARLDVQYAWRDASRRLDSLEFRPGYVARHRIGFAVGLFPSPTWALRLDVDAAAGRRTLPIGGAFEWEACNLLDRGCEFAGVPDYGQAVPGTTRLPAYLRLDAGLRKHWHVRVAGRDATVELFGTLTNLLGRANLLTYAVAEDGSRTGVEMLPRAPLVLGLDWSF